jgi:hypothetical protein
VCRRDHPRFEFDACIGQLLLQPIYKFSNGRGGVFEELDAFHQTRHKALQAGCSEFQLGDLNPQASVTLADKQDFLLQFSNYTAENFSGEGFETEGGFYNVHFCLCILKLGGKAVIPNIGGLEAFDLDEHSDTDFVKFCGSWTGRRFTDGAGGSGERSTDHCSNRDGGVTGDSDLAQDGAQGGTMLKTVSRAGDRLEEGEDPNVAQAVRET